jgi:OOP family OmpA-OmpF porin
MLFRINTFDGAGLTNSRGLSGLVFNGTVGLQVYLGKNAKHANWTVISENVDLTAYDNKLAELEAQIKNIPSKNLS